MNTTARILFDNAMQLPDSERAELAAWLIDSLESKFDEEVDQAWATEISQRIAQWDRAEVTGVPWPEARRMIMGQTDEPATD